MEESDILVKGKKVHYAQGGRGAVIVLVHGWTNNWRCWIPLFDHLKEKFTIYAIDLLGYGQSARLENYSIKIQADYLAGFLKELKLQPLAVCGLSMATFVVADFGLRFQDLAQSVILIGAIFPVDSKRKMIGRLVVKGLETLGRHDLSEAALKRLIELRITGYISAKYLTMYRFNRFLVDAYSLIGRKQMSKEVFVDMALSAYTYRLREVIDSLQIPTLLVYGSKDKFTRLAQARSLFTRKDIAYVEIDHAGHVVNLEQPALVAQAILSFLAQVKH